MHCPNCGTKASASQKFCRACGFGLEKVELLIAERKAASTDRTAEATGRLPKRLLKFEKWAGVALFSLGGILGGLLLWAIIFKAMIKQGKIWEGSAVLIILGIAALAVLLAYLEHMKKHAARSNQPGHPPQAPQTPQAMDTAKMLPEPNAEMAASATECATAKLEEKTIQ